jgi:hypothetical protein
MRHRPRCSAELEELGIQLEPTSIEHLHGCRPAYGQSGLVELVCFAGPLGGEPQPQGEVSGFAPEFLKRAGLAPASVQKAEYFATHPSIRRPGRRMPSTSAVDLLRLVSLASGDG